MLHGMSIVDWLETPLGVELLHAIIALITALAAWLSFQAKRHAEYNARQLNSHVERHHNGGKPQHIDKAAELAQPVVGIESESRSE